MTKRSAVLFTDFDGTLTKLDTFPIWFTMLMFTHPVKVFCATRECISNKGEGRLPKRVALNAAQRIDQKSIRRIQKISAITIVPFWRKGAKNFLKELKECGVAIVIVSNNAEIFVKPIAESVGADCMASHLSVNGEIVQMNGKNKEIGLKKWIQNRQGVGLHIFGIGDSDGDLEMLHCCETVFVIKRLCTQNNREIERFSQRVTFKMAVSHIKEVLT